VNTIKNQILEEQIFSQKFIVQQPGAISTTNYTFSFVRDRSEAGEFFLEISSNGATGTRTNRRICVVDIEAIEPIQGIKFKLVYHAKPTMMNQLSWKRDKTLRSEQFQSRHLAQIMDGLQQVNKLYEEQERQLDMFLAKSAPMEDVGLEQQEEQERENYRNCVVNVNGSFIATSDTYKARAAAAAITHQR